jgi:hypothetical protein
MNRQPKKDKEEWLAQCCGEIENQLNRGNTETSYNHIRGLFGKPPKNTIVESKEGKPLIEDEEIADVWQQYIEELYNDSEELEELERGEEITPEELGPTITKSGFEKALNEVK